MKRPYFKKSHQCWYYNDDQGTPVRLGKEEVEAKAKWAALLGTAADVQQGAITLRVLTARWLSCIEQEKSEGTYKAYAKYANAWAALHGDELADKIIGWHVTKFVAERYGKLSGSVRWQAQKVCCLIFSWAKQQGMVKDNPLAGYKKTAKCGVRQGHISQEQFDRLIAACPDPAFRDLLVCLWESGARPFCLFQAEARHLDRTRRTLTFSKAAGDKVKGKAPDAVRVIVLSTKAFEIVCRLADQSPEGSPLFKNSKGSRWTIALCCNRLKTLKERSGIKTSLYELRHSWAHIHATEKGTPILTLMALGGWASVKMLASVYAKVSDNHEHLLRAVG
jgi:integrase